MDRNRKFTGHAMQGQKKRYIVWGGGSEIEGSHKQEFQCTEPLQWVYIILLAKEHNFFLFWNIYCFWAFSWLFHTLTAFQYYHPRHPTSKKQKQFLGSCVHWCNPLSIWFSYYLDVWESLDIELVGIRKFYFFSFSNPVLIFLDLTLR